MPLVVDPSEFERQAQAYRKLHKILDTPPKDSFTVAEWAAKSGTGFAAAYRYVRANARLVGRVMLPGHKTPDDFYKWKKKS
jgi:hypothetical protein